MSQLFEAYRGYGLVAGSFPFCMEKKGPQTHVTVPVGKTFHTYNVLSLCLSLSLSLSLSLCVCVFLEWMMLLRALTDCLCACFVLSCSAPGSTCSWLVSGSPLAAFFFLSLSPSLSLSVAPPTHTH